MSTRTAGVIFTIYFAFLLLIPAGAYAKKTNHGHLIKSFSKTPLSFEKNQGQTDGQVKYLARSRGYTLYLTPSEAVLSLYKPSPKKSAADRLGSLPVGGGLRASDVLRMSLIGAKKNPEMAGEAQLAGKINYFIGRDSAKWRTRVPLYEKVRYQDVYPGIDLIYYGNQRKLEFDFIVSPGADPERIRLKFKGAKKISLNSARDLILSPPGGEVVQKAPVIYQQINGERKSISGKFILGAQNEVSFQVASYDKSKPLVIDPVLIYSTYLGGASDDIGVDMAVDSLGNVLIVGYTNSTDFPISTGTYQPSISGSGSSSDIFVAKLNDSGTALIYSTYLGGSGIDNANSIAVDSTGNAYLTGSTRSVDFPVTSGAFSEVNAGEYDVFVSKLNSDGSNLIYSTLVGGGGADAGTAIALDLSGNAYVAGSTWGRDYSGDPVSLFPTTSGAVQTVFGGYQTDAFVFKINSTGETLLYSTLLGGSENDAAYGLAVDISGNAFVTGGTYSAEFPITPGVFQASLLGSGSNYDVFVSKLNSSGTALVYSTFLGGSGTELGRGIVVDLSGNATVAGQTDSTDFPTTEAAYQRSLGGDWDAFVTKLNASGTGLLFSTYLGGSYLDDGSAIAINSSGLTYLAGRTKSLDFPTTPDAFQSDFIDTDLCFVLELNATGTDVTYSTFLGGGRNYCRAIAIDPQENIYVSGIAFSSSYPTTDGAFQTTFGGGTYDAFIAKIELAPPAPPNNPPLASCQVVIAECGAGGVAAADIDAGSSDPDGDPITLSQVPPGPYSLGNTSVTLTVTDDLGDSDSCSATVTVQDTTAPALAQPADVVAEATGPSGAVVSFSLPGTTDACDASVSVASSPVSGSTFPLGATAVTVTAMDANNNSSEKTFTVTVQDTAPPVINSVSVNSNVLFPPDHKMKPVSVTVDAEDNVSLFPSSKIISVTSNEPVNGTGDGDTAPDWEITGDLTLNLRAERSGGGNGRIYTITVQSTDESGNNSLKTVTVSVPISQGNGQATVDWTAVSEAVSYNVYRKSCPTCEKVLVASDQTGTQFVDTAVLVGMSYIYSVQAVDASGGLSNLGNERSVCVAPPKNLALSNRAFTAPSSITATDTIVAGKGVNVGRGSRVTFHMKSATGGIRLEPGFKVDSGASFRALVSTTSGSCS
ncbi:MAG: HYR domain-containing protein [Nitrospinaceae bacterium]|nr:HYR domain-containing protein [Nitrospinaceae bacterium]